MVIDLIDVGTLGASVGRWTWSQICLNHMIATAMKMRNAMDQRYVRGP